jgi:general secretion pathway protein G
MSEQHYKEQRKTMTENNPSLNRTRRQQAGFTLIEIMAVVLIMGLLMTLVGVNVAGQITKARIDAAKNQINSFESALELYHMDNARYPTSEQGLDSLVNEPSGSPAPRNYPPGGYIAKGEIPLDPWNEPYYYESPGQHNQRGYDLWSNGADGTPGGESIDTDIGNW